MDSLQRVFGVNGASGKPLHLCPNCGADVMAASWTERVIGQRVSNIWSCGTCGREFVTPTAKNADIIQRRTDREGRRVR